MWSLMAACDVLVNLRYPTMGETSGSVIRALSLGKPMLVSDVGWFGELPDDVVLKIPVDEYEVADARRRRSSSPPSTGAALGAAARDYVEREHALPGRRRLRRGARGGGRRRRGRRRGALADRRGGGGGRDRRRRRARPRSARRGDRRVTARAALGDAAVGCGSPAIVVALVGAPDRARAPDGRAVDHGRRAHLLRAREVVRGERPLPRPRRAEQRLRLRLPGR